MLQRRKVILALALTAAAITPALSQGKPVPETQACFDERLDQPADLPNRIAACLRVIGNKSASSEEHAKAYLRRSFAYAQSNSKGDLDRALADLSEASRLVPNNQDVQRYVLLRRAELALKAAESDKRGAKQVELPKDEARKTQEAFKAARPAALDSAKAPAPEPDPGKLARDLQSELKRVGCHPGAIDAQWGKSSRQALQKFAEHTTLALPLEEPTTAALDAVSAQKGRICPVACAGNETEINGRCVAKQRQVKGQPQRQPPRQESECEQRARAADPTGRYANYPCWARETFGRGGGRRQ